MAIVCFSELCTHASQSADGAVSLINWLRNTFQFWREIMILFMALITEKYTFNINTNMTIQNNVSALTGPM